MMKTIDTQPAEAGYTVKTKDLVQELAPLFKDYFTADATVSDENALLVSFTNGEKFEVTVRKV